MASGKTALETRMLDLLAFSNSTIQASGAPECPCTSPATDASGLSRISSSPTPLPSTGNTSPAMNYSGLFSSAPQAPGISQATGVSGIYQNLFSRNPQATSASQATSTSQATGTESAYNRYMVCPPATASSSFPSHTAQATSTPLPTGTSRATVAPPLRPLYPYIDSPFPITSLAAGTSGLFGSYPARIPQATGTSQGISASGAPSACKVPVASRKIPEMAPKQSPPIPFDKFASSEMFTIRLDNGLQTFHVHKDLLAGLSDEMRNYVYSGTEEGQEVGVEMEQVSPDTILRFMEFCYSGDYLYGSGAENDFDDPLKNKDATAALPLLLTHAKLYVFADMFNIVSLKELSANKIIALTPFFGKLEDRAHGLAMISLMGYVLNNMLVTSEAPDKLVKFLARYAGYLIEELGGYPEFHTVLAFSGREDFFKVFCRWVKAGDSKAPWTDAE